MLRALLLVPCLLAAPAWAQQSEPVASDPVTTVVEQQAAKAEREAELARLKALLEATDARRTALKAELAQLEGDRGAINRALVEAAKRTQSLEAEIGASEQRLDALTADDARIRVSLAARSETLSHVLAALQRMGTNPPPALLVSPQDALASVRSAVLLGAVVPPVADEAKRLSLELTALADTRASIDIERQGLRASLAALAADEERLEGLIATKNDLFQTSTADLAREAADAARMAEKATTLTGLIQSLESGIASAAEAAAAARSADDARRAVEAARLDTARARIAEETANAPDPARIAPAVAFSESLGKLPLPVQGVELYRFGAPLRASISASRFDPAPNMALATRANARVRAPADGWVVYAGPFRSYGQLLILNAGDGYHIVMSGMAQLDVPTGRFVLAGEPVGRMGTRRLGALAAGVSTGLVSGANTVSDGDVTRASSGTGTVGADRPVLYIEFRKNGEPVDPAPWWDRTQAVAQREPALDSDASPQQMPSLPSGG